MSPQKRDCGLRFLEPIGLPQIDPVVVWTDNLPQPEHRTLKTLEDLGDIPAASALRDGRFNS